VQKLGENSRIYVNSRRTVYNSRNNRSLYLELYVPLNDLGHPAFSLQWHLTADEVASCTVSHRRGRAITRTDARAKVEATARGGSLLSAEVLVK
jgi:hypothetical protein